MNEVRFDGSEPFANFSRPRQSTIENARVNFTDAVSDFKNHEPDFMTPLFTVCRLDVIRGLKLLPTFLSILDGPLVYQVVDHPQIVGMLSRLRLSGR
jgi:hypothetical protein